MRGTPQREARNGQTVSAIIFCFIALDTVTHTHTHAHMHAADRLLPIGEEQEAMEEGARPDTDSATPLPVDVISRIASCLEELKKCVEEAHHTMVSYSGHYLE